MIKQEDKWYILDVVSSNSAARWNINNPVILLGEKCGRHSDSVPILIDDSTPYTLTESGVWDIPEYGERKSIWFSVDVGSDLTGPHKIDQYNDPEFIEQVKVAFQLARL